MHAGFEYDDLIPVKLTCRMLSNDLKIYIGQAFQPCDSSCSYILPQITRCLNLRSLLCPHIPGGIQVESMLIPCGFHPFHMEFVWLRAQPFWRKFPYSFHMESPWNLNIPWNISLESRWNPPQFIPCNSTWIPHIPHGFHIFHMDSIYSTWIPYIPHGFHIFHMDSTYSTWIPLYFIWIPHGFISNI